MKFFKQCAVIAALAFPNIAGAATIDLASEGYQATTTTVLFSGEAVVLTTSFSVVNPNFSAFSLNSLAAENYIFQVTDFFGPDLILGSGADVAASMFNYTGGSTFDGIVSQVLFEDVTAEGAFESLWDGAAVLVTAEVSVVRDPVLSATAGQDILVGTGAVTVTLLEDLVAVPLPAGGLLLLTGAGALIALRRRKTA